MNILMIGPKSTLKGGIATVVKNYFNSNFIVDNNVEYLNTVIAENKIINFLYSIICYLRLIAILSRKNISIVHIHMSYKGSFYRKCIVIIFSKIFKKKILIHLHGSKFDIFYEESSKRKKCLITKILNLADIIVTLSNEWKSKIENYCETEVVVLHNAVNLPPQNMYNPMEQNIIMMGTLGERKGTYDLLEAAKIILSKRRNVKFLLCGNGELEKISKFINDNNLENNIILLGWVEGENKVKVLKEAMLNILPSYNEGMPMSILEAMSYGIPTISTHIGGIPKIIDESNGILINPGDINSLVESINYLLDNSEIRHKMSTNAYIQIQKKFSLNNHIKELIEIYNKIQVG